MFLVKNDLDFSIIVLTERLILGRKQVLSGLGQERPLHQQGVRALHAAQVQKFLQKMLSKQKCGKCGKMTKQSRLTSKIM